MRMRSRSLKRGSLRGAAPPSEGPPGSCRKADAIIIKDSSSLEILHLEQRSPQILPQKRIKVEEGDTSYCDIGGSLMRNVTM